MPANNPISLSVKPWEPDLPAFASGKSSNVRNVLPRTQLSYGPFPNLSTYSTSPLGARCQGAYAGIDAAGNVNVFCGTSSDLYRMTASATTFTNVSKSVGGYNVAADEFWRFTLFGQRIIATNISDNIQSFVIGTDTAFSDLSANAPKARYIATIKNFVMVGNTYDPVGGEGPQRVWWSAFNTPGLWPAIGSASAAAQQSDYNDFPGEGGWIQGIVGNLGTADGAIFQEHAVWRAIYSGPPNIFDFAPAEGVRGTPAPSSIVQLGAFVYYLGEDGFYIFDGTSSKPIGANRVDKTFFADLDQSYISRVYGAVDPINKIVFWAYPGQGHNQGNPNHIIAYNWVLDRWSIADIETEIIFRTLSFGYTLDDLDSTGYNLDNLPFPLDSRAWTGGALQLAAFDSNHNLSYFSGSNLAPTVETEEIQPFNGQRAFIRNTRPIVDGGSPSIAIGTRELTENSTTFGSAVAMNSLGWCPQRASGRYVRAKLTLPAGSSFTHIQGAQIDADPVGAR